MKSKQKNMVILLLLAIVIIMVAGYAAFSSSLRIGGSANVANSWDVKITDISLKASSQNQANPYGTADSPSTFPGGGTNPTYTDTMATFYSTLNAPGDSVTYVVTIVNNGSVNAKVSDISWVNDDDSTDQNYNLSPIIYSYSFPNRNQVLAKNGGTTSLEVTVTYDPEVTDQPADGLLEKSATLSINYSQI